MELTSGDHCYSILYRGMVDNVPRELAEGGEFMAQISLPVEGMTCNHCKAAVEKSLLKVNGVSGAEVDLAGKKASIAYDADVATRDQLVKAVEDAGFSVPA